MNTEEMETRMKVLEGRITSIERQLNLYGELICSRVDRDAIRWLAMMRADIKLLESVFGVRDSFGRWPGRDDPDN